MGEFELAIENARNCQQQLEAALIAMTGSFAHLLNCLAVSALEPRLRHQIELLIKREIEIVKQLMTANQHFTSELYTAVCPDEPAH